MNRQEVIEKLEKLSQGKTIIPENRDALKNATAFKQLEDKKDQSARNGLKYGKAYPTGGYNNYRGCVVQARKIKRIKTQKPMVNDKIVNKNGQKARKIGAQKSLLGVGTVYKCSPKERNKCDPLQKTDLGKDQCQCRECHTYEH